MIFAHEPQDCPARTASHHGLEQGASAKVRCAVSREQRSLLVAKLWFEDVSAGDVGRVAGLEVATLLSDVTPSCFPRPTHRGNRETILSILGYLRLGSSPQIIVWK